MSVVAALLANSAQPLLAIADPSVATGGGTGLGTVVTSAVQANPVGGVGPYTYSWTYLSGDVGFSAVSSTSTSTTFSITLSTYSDYKVAVWRCTITDSAGQTATCDVDVIATENSYF